MTPGDVASYLMRLDQNGQVAPSRDKGPLQLLLIWFFAGDHFLGEIIYFAQPALEHRLVS